MAKKVVVEATINGEQTEFLCEPRQSLLEALRDVLELTGSKEGCLTGDCGACTVISGAGSSNAVIAIIRPAARTTAARLRWEILTKATGFISVTRPSSAVRKPAYAKITANMVVCYTW